MANPPPPNAISEQDIEQFIQDYLKNALPLRQKTFHMLNIPEENLSCNAFGQGPFLIINKCNLLELPINLLRRLPIYLIRQFTVQVEYDSFWYWALTNDIISRTHRNSILKDWELIDAFKALMASHFAKLNYHDRGVSSLERLNRATNEIVSQPVKDLVNSKDVFLMYICYPVLEGLTKFVLSPLIDNDGNTVSQFTVRVKGQSKTYHVGDPKISNLGVLLRALEENGSSRLSKPDLSNNLKDFRTEIEAILPPASQNDDGWDSIFALRNSSLHGVKGWQLRSGLITNLISLILWNVIDDVIVTKELAQLAQRRRMAYFFDYNYYPPEM